MPTFQKALKDAERWIKVFQKLDLKIKREKNQTNKPNQPTKTVTTRKKAKWKTPHAIKQHHNLNQSSGQMSFLHTLASKL